VTRLSRERLDLASASVLALLVLAGASASSNEHLLRTAGSPARLLLLVVLGGLALVTALRFRSEWRLRPWVAAGAAAFCALAFVSTGWAVLPMSTLKRDLSLAAVLVVAVLVAGSTAHSPRTTRLLLDGILVAAAVFAAGGLVLWLFDASKAVQPATTEYAARFQGLGDNPDTAPLLFAIAMPIALQRALAPGARRARALALATLLGLAAAVTASGSRGGLLAGFLSLLVVVWLAPMTLRRRAAASAAVVAALALCAWVTTVPSALPQHGTAAPALAQPHGHRGIDAESVLPLEAEIGSPWWTHKAAGVHRSLFGASSRVRALQGAIHQALGRPLLGTGFGAELFVSRYYGFHSGNPEDGYVGLLMQVGAIGLALFVAFVAICMAPALRRRALASAAVGAVAAGLLLGLSQSFFHAAGDIVFVPFWLLLLLGSQPAEST